MSEVRYFPDKFPKDRELSAQFLWEKVLDEKDLVDYFPDSKKIPPKYFLVLVLNSKRGKQLRKIIKEIKSAKKKRKDFKKIKGKKRPKIAKEFLNHLKSFKSMRLNLKKKRRNYRVF